ncbi:Eukaryotic initiation factor 4E [Lotmaria passim]
MSATHALRDRWFVSFLPLLTADMVNTDYKGNWQLAAQERTQKLDWITSVEELWSTMNSLPKVHQLGMGSTLIFARNKKEPPSYESFPNGSRITINLLKPPTTDGGLELVLATVMGETVAEKASAGRPVCDVLRIAARPSREHPEQIRVEVWLSDATCSHAVTEFLSKAMKEKGLPANSYSISESSFDTASPTTKDKKGLSMVLSPSSSAITKE